MATIPRFLNIYRTKCSVFQISLGISFGMLLGLYPSLLNLQSFAVILLALFLRVPWRHMVTAIAVSFALATAFLDSLSHTVGSAILGSHSLEPLFTGLYNSPLIPFTRFYNSVIMGASILTIALFPLVFFACHKAKVRGSGHGGKS